MIAGTQRIWRLVIGSSQMLRYWIGGTQPKNWKP